MQSFLLGIDIGTSKNAAVIIDSQARLQACAVRRHRADRPASTNPNHDVAEQSVEKLFSSVKETITELPAELRERVEAVGVTSQAHGIALFDRAGQALTPLITWQDKRCLRGDFLTALQQATGQRLHSGYGCATLAWLAAHGELPPDAAGAVTIADACVRRLCQSEPWLTDATMAASMGLFDLRRLDWDEAAIATARIPRSLLPQVRPTGARAGRVQPEPAAEWGLTAGIPVAMALGDNQASLLATLADPERDLALTLGTGGQLSAILPPDLDIAPWLTAETFEVRPFRDGRYSVVAAILSGGAAWLWLVEAMEQLLRDLGQPGGSRNELFARLNQAGLEANGDLVIHPQFNGERHQPALRGRIEQLGPHNFSLGNLARGVARGIFTDLRAMLPPAIFAGRTRLVASGNALRRNPLLQAMAAEVFQLPIEFSSCQEEAAIGAALNAVALLGDPSLTPLH